MKNLFYIVLSFALLSTAAFAVDLEANCEDDKTFQELKAVTLATEDMTAIKPAFNFEWNDVADFKNKAEEFTLTGTIVFPKTVSVFDAFKNNFLSEQAVMSVIHSASGVKTLNQDFNNSKEPKDLPAVGKVVPFHVTGQKCKYFICRSGTMESNCKFTEKTETRSVLDCAGIPNDNMKSHSTKITCDGGANVATKCNFVLKGQPGSRRYALGGAAESLYNFYGLAYRSVSKNFSESAFEKTGVPATINTFYNQMINSNNKNYSPK